MTLVDDTLLKVRFALMRDSMPAPMFVLDGVEVYLSPLVPSGNKVEYKGPGSATVVREFNAWLGQMFGAKPVFLASPVGVFTNQRGLEMVRSGEINSFVHRDEEWQP